MATYGEMLSVYYRFQSAIAALRECEGCLHADDLTREEKEIRDQLVQLCQKIASDFENDTKT